jgi:hypothetical protein
LSPVEELVLSPEEFRIDSENIALFLYKITADRLPMSLVESSFTPRVSHANVDKKPNTITALKEYQNRRIQYICA